MTRKTKETLKLLAKIFLIVEAVLAFWLVYPIVLGIFAYKYLDDESAEQNVRVIWAVLTFVFVSRVAGIIMGVNIFLPVKDDEAPAVEEKKAE